MKTPSRRLLAAVIAGAVLFALGWWLGRRPAPSAESSSPAASTETGPPGEDAGGPRLEIRLDADVVLLPDASLELRPIRPLDAGDASP